MSHGSAHCHKSLRPGSPLIWKYKKLHEAMPDRLRVLITLLLLCVPSYANAQFVVYREFFFTGQPPDVYFDSLGMKRSHGIYENEVTGGQPPVKESLMRSTAHTAMELPSQQEYLKWYDIEYLSTDVERVGREQAKQNADTLAKYIGWAKSQEPRLQVGIYSMTPVADIYISSRYELRKAWNDVTQSLADSLNFLCPSLYLYYPEDRIRYASYAPLLVGEAKRLGRGKNVFPFIAPGYHPAGSLAHAYASKEVWGNVLKTIKNSGADGCVIFAGKGAMGGQYGDWAQADTSGWWAATKAFLDSLRHDNGASLSSPTSPADIPGQPDKIKSGRKHPFLPP